MTEYINIHMWWRRRENKDLLWMGKCHWCTASFVMKAKMSLRPCRSFAYRHSVLLLKLYFSLEKIRLNREEKNEKLIGLGIVIYGVFLFHELLTWEHVAKLSSNFPDDTQSLRK